MLLRRLFIPALLLLTACTEAPKEAKKKEPEKPPEPVSGRFAFQQTYGAARAWSTDIQTLTIQNIHLPEVPSKGGKSGAWSVTFTSLSKQKSKSFTYSAIEAGGNLHQGVFAGGEENFTGARGQAKPFLPAAIRVDTDEILATAMKKGEDYAKKHPDMPITFLLEWTPRFPNPAWRVIWGPSISQSSFSIFVDASTGEYLATGR